MAVNKQWGGIGLIVVGLLVGSAITGWAEEQRCIDLASNCICSEPFQMTSFSSGPDFWNPTDSTTKECSVEDAVHGASIVRTASDITSSTNATALSKLPGGNTVSRFVRAGADHEGTFYAGHGLAVSSSYVRLAARWYIWHTAAFDFKLENTCENSKIAQFDNGALVDYTSGGTGFHTYNYLSFTPSVDCCVSGPGPDHDVAAGDMKGKWWRWEVVLTNRNGPDFRIEMYAKNVTDNTAELKVIDLWDDPSVDNLTPPSLMSQITSNNHRFASTGSCNGWIGLSHYMMAGWTTNAGQRIGAASEVEGGVGASGGAGSDLGF
jgi:hypothetical protein